MKWYEVCGIVVLVLFVLLMITFCNVETRNQLVRKCIAVGYSDYTKWNSTKFCVNQQDGVFVLVPYSEVIE